MFEAIIEILIIVVFIYTANDAYGKLKRGQGGKVTHEGRRLARIALVVGIFAFFAVWDLLNNSLAVLWAGTERLSLKIFTFLPIRNSLKPIILIGIVIVVCLAVYVAASPKIKNKLIRYAFDFRRKNSNKSVLEQNKIGIDKSTKKYLTSMFLDKFDQYINDDEFRDICLDLEVEYENLSGNHKRARMRSLMKLLNRQSRIEILVKRLQKIRPNVNW